MSWKTVAKLIQAARLRRGAYTRIDGWYNARRRHFGIGYLSPRVYDRRQLALAA